MTATLTAGDLYLVEVDSITLHAVSALAAGGDVVLTSLTGDVLARQVNAAGLVSLEAVQGAILAQVESL